MRSPYARLHGLDRERHGAQVKRQARSLRDQLAVGEEQRGREVERFLHHERARRAVDGQRHFVGERHQRVLDELERKGVALERTPGRRELIRVGKSVHDEVLTRSRSRSCPTR